MAHFEFGYMEGDHLGRPYDFRLLARLAAYGRPYLKLICLAAVLILFSTGIDLLLPFLSRLAIDKYMVRQALRLETAKAPAPLTSKLKSQAGEDLLRSKPGVFFIKEEDFRKLDPRLAARLRASGAVDKDPWYMAPEEEVSTRLAQIHPDLFLKVRGRLLIPAKDLARLKPDERADLRRTDVMGLIQLAVLFLIAAVLAAALGFFQHFLLEKAGQEMMFNLRQDLYAHLLGRALSFFGKNPVGKLATRLTNDVQNINEMYRNTIVALFQDFFLLAGIVATLLLLDASLALLCLGLAPVIAALAWVFARLAREAFRSMQGLLGRINSLLSETLSGMAVVKLFGAEEEGGRRFKKLNDQYFQAGMRQIKVFAVFMPLTELLASLAAGLIIWYGGGQVTQDRLSLGTLVAFLFYMQMFFRPVRDLAEKYNVLQSAMASAERIFHLFDSKEALPEPSKTVSLPPAGQGRISFMDVGFSYEPGRPVLKNISFEVPPGQTWAIVGPTGAGKTTLVRLLLRLADPDRGKVLLDGHDVREIKEDDLAAQVALVSQEVFLLSGSVEENITLNRPQVTREMLRKALSVSGADSFVDRLPQGLATPLGEGARRLSAGQRQLLALARALAGDPGVLVLDEATSSVDPESERLIQKALPRVMAERTSLVVAHRLSTIAQAHRILVMHKGEIAEKGTHDELTAAGGLYARLVRLQELKAQKENIYGNRNQG